MLIKSLKTTKTIVILLEFNDLVEVFSKELAPQVPPYRPWHCTIGMLPNTSPPKSQIYPFSTPEIKAIENYIEESSRVFKKDGRQILFRSFDISIKKCIQPNPGSRVGRMEGTILDYRRILCDAIWLS